MTEQTKAALKAFAVGVVAVVAATVFAYYYGELHPVSELLSRLQAAR